MDRRLFIKTALFAGAALFLDLSLPKISEKTRKPKKVIYTFDDVPYELERTEQLCKILTNNNCQSQFYLTGDGIKKFPESVEFMISNGFEVGWHSMHHEKMRMKDDKEFLGDVYEWKKTLKDFCRNYEPNYARFPYGMGTMKQMDLLEKEGLNIQPCARRGKHSYNWDIDSKDSDPRNFIGYDKMPFLLNRIKNDPVVILFHMELAVPFHYDNGKKCYTSQITGKPLYFERLVQNINSF
jgi:peptidoglycan/xylan/chitin deacetylase (PgdA/CDA1 family)